MIQKLAIYGAGAIGGWMGVKLAQAGCTLSVVARGATLAALRADGLRLRDGEAEHRVAVQASDQPADLGVQDLVVVAVKAPSMGDVARAIRGGGRCRSGNRRSLFRSRYRNGRSRGR